MSRQRYWAYHSYQICSSSDAYRSLVELGYIYTLKAQYQKAEKCLLEGYQVYKSDPRLKSDFSFGYCLITLATYYKYVGDYHKALDYYFQARDVMKEIVGTRNWDYYSILYNIGRMYTDLGDYSTAKKMFESIMNSEELSQADREVNLPYVLEALLIVYTQTGETVSEKKFIELLELEKKKGDNQYGNALSVYSKWLFENQRYSEAIQLDTQALRMRIDELDPNCNFVIDINTNLSLSYSKLHEMDSCRKYFLLSYNSSKLNIYNSIDFMTDQEISYFTNKQNSYTYNLLGWDEFDFQNYGGFYYDDALLFKGILQYSRIVKNRFILRDSSLHELFEDYKSFKRYLVSEYSKPFEERKDIPQFEEKANVAEKKLSLHIKGLTNYCKQVHWNEIQSKLQIDEAAVEFINYSLFKNGKQLDSNWYAALIVRKGDTVPLFIPLCPEKSIIGLLSGEYKRRMEYVSKLYQKPNNLAGNQSIDLYNLIWKHIEPYLQNTSTVFYSPTGLLHKINLGAIAFPNQTLAMDHQKLIMLPSTRELITDNKENEKQSTECVLIGGIRYDLDSIVTPFRDTLEYQHDLSSRGEYSFYQNDSSLRAGKWKYLDGTMKEVNKINGLLEFKNFKVSTISGIEATEETFKSLGKSSTRAFSPRVIHVSTHGFFFPDPKEVGSLQFAVGRKEETVFKQSTDPMIRSGLIFAGANYAWQNGKPINSKMEDGILTAYEISLMDLSNTELVVLSACETGLGEIAGNEGVYGLQRAFKIAGVKNILMSLWQVPDKQTSELMELFYKNWIDKKLSIRDALYTSQNTMRKKGLEPYYWAGFVLME